MTDNRYKRSRKMETRKSVRIADKVANLSITIGGVGTILAVSAVFVFLVAVVVPLFLPGSKHEQSTVPFATTTAAPLVRVAVDEYRVAAWALTDDGTVHAVRLDTGEALETRRWVDGDSVSAWSVPEQGGTATFGFRDGSVRLGTIGFQTDFVPAETLPEKTRGLGEGEVATVGATVVEKTPEGQFRRQRLEVDLGPALSNVGGSEPVLLDRVGDRDASIICMLCADGELRIRRVERNENLLTGEVEFDVTGGSVQTPYARGAVGGRGVPRYVVVNESATDAYLIWPGGHLVHYDIRDIEKPVAAGSIELLDDGALRITAFKMLLGGRTFLVGDSSGRVRAWFQFAGDDDEFEMAPAHTFEGNGQAVTALAPSPRSRIFAAGCADGSIRMYQVTSGAKILDFQLKGGGPVEALSMPPKGDGLVALAPSGLHNYAVDVGHPEATLASMFAPVWYEGYPSPQNAWQSSSGADDFEPKFGMWPLVFGTIKATFYSMLFGIPLALLAAIFTSEFMSPRVKPRVKTLIESMASLPSVVLGFLAALVFAPFVHHVIPGVMMGFVTVPAVFLVGAYAWQMMPVDATLRMARFRLLFILAALPVGVWLAAVSGPWVERLFFGGDIVVWLDGTKGSGVGGWLILLLPLSSVAVVLLMGRFVGPRFREFASRSTRTQVAVGDALRFAAGAVLTVAIALAGSWLLDALGVDPRGSDKLLHTYVQRNALVVGFVMGFAIIPIIYTIAEDALSAVPDHLRAASLGAGATPWQTAIRIVLPTAMSGLFSAIMIGLGRAVGETMIVLMAAGNTPVLEMNIFNGFRTLSANIAVELPEAVRDSTHYRTLFLAALILFLLTFTINTVAEMVRLRFRRRSAQI